MRLIDAFLNRVTMYRLVLYVLIALLVIALILGSFVVLAINPFMLLFSILFISVLCWTVNTFFSLSFDAPANVESFFITALILVLLISPPQSLGDGTFVETAFWASVWAMASKYIFAIGRKHIFNPAAFGVAITAITLNQSASWWVGTLPMMPFALIGGLLIVRKIQRFDLFLVFSLTALVAILAAHLTASTDLVAATWNVLTVTPLIFFATVMLTEPLTMPPTRNLRILFGVIVGVLFAPWVHIGSFYSTPEIALLVGNAYAYIVSPKQKLLLVLQKKLRVATGIYDFWFTSPERFAFRPGQYLEWTLELEKADNRGNRRTFTISSAPTEEGIAMGVRFYPEASAFKRRLAALQPGDTIVASQLSGEFVLPPERGEKVVFIAGGIGVTPFRSMIKDMLDRNDARPTVLFYSNKRLDEIAYRDVFDTAHKRIGTDIVYTLTDPSCIPPDWKGETGRVDEAMIRRWVPECEACQYYLSGTHGMVTGTKKMLRRMGVPPHRITTDFFPGFA